jgi:hypothetical protein
MAEQDITTIERRRRTLRISTVRLCGSAGVGRQTYRYALAGLYAPRPATLAKLNHALHRFQIGFAGEASRIAPHAAYKACVILACFLADKDDWDKKAKIALGADPARRATADPVWLAAAHTRRVAFAIANQVFGFSISDVARAGGVTKAAVSAAIPELEDLRDHDAALDLLLNRLEEVVRP